MDGKPVFVNDKLYRCKVQDALFDRVGANRQSVFKVEFVVVGGEMAGETLTKTFFFSKDSKDRSIEELKRIGMNPLAGEIREWPAKAKAHAGEVAVKCQIGWNEKKQKNFPPQAGSIMDPNELVPGSIEAEIAAALGNPDTAAANPEEFNDNY